MCVIAFVCLCQCLWQCMWRRRACATILGASICVRRILHVHVSPLCPRLSPSAHTCVCYYTQRWLSDLQASWVHIAASTPGAAPPGNLSPLFESCLAVVRRCKTFGRPGFKQTVRNGILFADAEDDVRAHGSDCVCLCVDMRPCSLRKRLK